ncbi:MAG TPA: hypothetical protein EYP08_08785 [Pyrodictiaceae archaeon]|nr:hypothetical protein [Pyrodictiaceae archaeon]
MVLSYNPFKEQSQQGNIPGNRPYKESLWTWFFAFFGTLIYTILFWNGALLEELLNALKRETNIYSRLHSVLVRVWESYDRYAECMETLR